MIAKQVDPVVFIRIAPALQRIAEQYGMRFLGVIHQGNAKHIPQKMLSTARVVEEGSLFNLGMKTAPVQYKIYLWQLALAKAKAMGAKYVALRLPTKWERFKVWGWRELPGQEVKKGG